jgi:CheY-like chemotaxis protein
MAHGFDGLDTDFNLVSKNPCLIRKIRVKSIKSVCQTSSKMENPLKILIVEDEMLIAANIAIQLETIGYEVVGIIPRGEEAVKVVQNERPDLVLMDINLKGELDGIETAKKLQQDGEIPIIYLTANSDDAHFERAKETNPYAFITTCY